MVSNLEKYEAEKFSNNFIWPAEWVKEKKKFFCTCGEIILTDI